MLLQRPVFSGACVIFLPPICRSSRELGGVGLIRHDNTWSPWIYSPLQVFSLDGVKMKRQDVHAGACCRVWEPRRFKFGRRTPGFGPRLSGYSCASAAFLLFLHRGEDLMRSPAVPGLLGVSSSTGTLNWISLCGDFSCERLWQKLCPDPGALSYRLYSRKR